MSSAPWTVKRTKRKPPSTDPLPRKRVRVSDDVAAPKSSARKSSDQQTLTQIQWADSPQTSFQDDDVDLQKIERGQIKGSRSRSSSRRKPVKRDSTLTQMDWLGGFRTHQDQNEDDMRMLSETKNNLVQTPALEIDDASDGQPKKRARKIGGSTDLKSQNKSSSPIPYETQDYRPASSSKKSTKTGSGMRNSRRRSSRIAAKALSDVDDNHIVGEVASSKQSLNIVSPSRQPPQVGQNVTNHIKDDSLMKPPPEPQTPRRRYEVPSSQTPETILKSKYRSNRVDAVSPSKTSGRTPLRERSTNIQTRTYSQGLEASHSLLGTIKKSPKPRKVCVLKVPSKEALRRSKKTDKGSQRDVFSIPITSSSSRNNDLSDPVESINQPPKIVLQQEVSVEIPGTSEPRDSSDHEMPSSPPAFPLDESLPTLRDLIPVRELESQMLPEARDMPIYNQASKENSTMVQDFGEIDDNDETTPRARRRTPQLDQHDDHGDEVLHDGNDEAQESQLQNLADKTTEVENDDSDFGSPVANDTQFNINLQQRTSSPSVVAASTNVSTAKDLKVTPSKPSKLGRLKRKSPATDRKQMDDTEIDIQTPLPTPRLIENSSPSTRLLQLSSEKNEDEAAPIPSSDGYVTVSTEILSDNIPSLPSSPQMLPPARPVTQRSIHPASMPRPSQVSTQDPTQSYYPSSAPVATQHQDEIERITIKDSSSVPPRLSQVPSYNGRSQHRGVKSQRTNNWDDDLDDLDLDPSSINPRGRNSARKLFYPPKQTASSLKSIHLPVTKSSQQTEDPNLSPSLRPQIPPFRQNTSSLNFIQIPTNLQPRETRADHSKHQDNVRPTTITQDQAEEQGQQPESLPSSPVFTSSPDHLPPLKRKHEPLPGFDNDTQSNFTQDGHVTAAYIHRQREAGILPDWFVPSPHQIPNWTGRAKDKRRKGN